MIFGQRRRAEVSAELAGAKLYLAEVRAAAMRRAADLSRIVATPGRPGHLRAFLRVTARNLLTVAEAAEAALGDFESSDLDELVASSEDAKEERRTGQRARAGHPGHREDQPPPS